MFAVGVGHQSCSVAMTCTALGGSPDYRAATICPTWNCLGCQHRGKCRIPWSPITMTVDRGAGWRLRICSVKGRQSTIKSGDTPGCIQEDILESSASVAVALMALHTGFAVKCAPRMGGMST